MAVYNCCKQGFDRETFSLDIFFFFFRIYNNLFILHISQILVQLFYTLQVNLCILLLQGIGVLMDPLKDPKQNVSNVEIKYEFTH